MKQALVVDDHPVMREGIRDLLEKAFPWLQIEVSSGSDGVLEEVWGTAWDCVVLDINLPGKNGLDIIKQAKSRRSKVPIIVYSLYPENRYGARALRAGAVAYLSKERPSHDLIKAVAKVLEGVSRPDARQIPQPFLSDREVQVLALYVRGLDRQEIAEQLHISQKTVTTYRARLLQKLDVRNTVEMVRYAVDEGLVD